MPKTLEDAARNLLLAMKLDHRAQAMEFGTEMEELRAALASSETVRVPREPTKPMLEAAVAYSAGGVGRNVSCGIYRAMLAAHEKDPTDGR